jgi:hypothetical protein
MMFLGSVLAIPYQSINILLLLRCMKRLIDILKREWFLLVMLAAITLIVLLFELF